MILKHIIIIKKYYNPNIPDDVTVISRCTFAGCTSLRSVRLPDGLTTIGKSAFEQCISLESLSIPDGVTEIEEDAFRNCAYQPEC